MTEIGELLSADLQSQLRAAANEAAPPVEQPSQPAEQRESNPEEMIGDFMEIAEGSLAKDGTFLVRIIQPGWSENKRYYPAEVLRRDAAKVYPAGMHMFWNHATKAEATARPEGNLDHLAGVLVTAPEYRESGPYGPGVYSRAKAFPGYAERIAEMAPHIGVSHRVLARGVAGEAESRSGTIITSLEEGISVDLVTKPGAGGRILELFESAPLGGANRNAQPQKEAHEMSEEQINATEAATTITALRAELATAQSQITELSEAKTALDADLKVLREAAILGKAKAIVEKALAESKLPSVTRQRLAESLVADPPVVDGELDEAALTSAIVEATNAAAAEVAAIVGTGVTGMGSVAAESGSELKETFKRHFIRSGKSVEEAEKLAGFAASGR